jgi:hypothetical protein
MGLEVATTKKIEDSSDPVSGPMPRKMRPRAKGRGDD